MAPTPARPRSETVDPNPPDLVIQGGTIINAALGSFSGPGDLLVSGGLIASVGGRAPGAAVVLDARGCVVTPGLINAHLHLGETYLRGRVAGLTLDAYVKYSAESYRDPRWREMAPALFRTSARQTLVESALFGVSTICSGRGWREMREFGLRGLAGYPVWKCAKLETYYQDFPAGLDRCLADDDDLVRTAIYLQSPLHFDPALAGAVADRLRRNPSLRYYIHVAETRREIGAVRKSNGCSPFELLESYGLLGPQAILVHGVQATRKDIELVARSGASVVLCPTSNAKLGVGRPPVAAWFRAVGPRVAIGTDGLATNDSASLLEAAKFAALVASDRAVDGRAVFAAVTTGAAEALGLAGVTGRLEEGLAADVAVWRPIAGGVPPEREIVGDLVYNGAAYALRHLVVAGRPIVWDGRLQTADPARTFAEMREAADRLFGRDPAPVPEGRASP